VRRRSPAVSPTTADTLGQAAAVPAVRPTRGPRRAASASAVATAAVGGERATSSRPTLKRRADAGAEDRGRRFATRLGRRPSGGSQAIGPRALEPGPGPANEVANLGSGVFVERNIDLGHELREGGPPRTASR